MHSIRLSKQDLIARWQRLVAVAQGAWWQRFLANPVRYAQAMYYLRVHYPRHRTGVPATATTFFGATMHLLLPAATDIYLTGGKTHSSELRLARFFMEHLHNGDTCLDVGAHVGYFTLLAATLVGERGRVISLEAASATFEVLRRNTAAYPQIQAHHKAAAATAGELTFYEFPVLYSEYNTTAVEQFEKESWYKGQPPVAHSIAAIPLAQFSAERHIKLVKIDVEGAEYEVLRGAEALLQQHSPLVVLEYLAQHRQQPQYSHAAALLADYGYAAHTLSAEGALVPCADIPTYLAAHGVESDNIVFVKNPSDLVTIKK